MYWFYVHSFGKGPHENIPTLTAKKKKKSNDFTVKSGEKAVTYERFAQQQGLISTEGSIIKMVSVKDSAS